MPASSRIPRAGMGVETEQAETRKTRGAVLGARCSCGSLRDPLRSWPRIEGSERAHLQNQRGHGALSQRRHRPRYRP